MQSPLSTAGDVKRHIGIKLMLGELEEPIAQRMLDALDRGASADYAALLEAAIFRDPPALVYHTAPPSRRSQIRRLGLIVSQPGRGGSWAPNRAACVMLQARQPPGVYVTREPDSRGVFAHWPTWDIWEVRRGDLPWRHDRLNPGCWSLAAAVPAGRLRLAGRYSGDGALPEQGDGGA